MVVGAAFGLKCHLHHVLIPLLTWWLLPGEMALPALTSFLFDSSTLAVWRVSLAGAVFDLSPGPCWLLN